MNRKAVFAYAIRIFENVERKHLSLIAAGLTYWFVMALFPAVAVLAAVVAYLPWEGGMQRVTAFLAYVMPPPAMSLFEQILSTVRPHRGGLLSFGIIATIWLSSKAVMGIISGLDIVHEVRVPRRMWTNGALAFGLTFGVGILLLLGVALTLTGPVVEAILERTAAQSLWVRFWPYVRWIPAAIFIFAAIELLYLLAPNLPVRQRTTVPGALLAAAGWLALSWGLGFYFHYFGGGEKLARLYEFLATPIAVMIWLYWGAFTLLIGAEINASLEHHKSSKGSAQADPQPPARAA